jgi:hypothetical protein
VLQHKRRRGTRNADRERPFRQRRLLAHAGLEVRVRPAQALRDGPRHRFDLRLELFVDAQRTSGHASEELYRAIVVRRPEPA